MLCGGCGMCEKVCRESAFHIAGQDTAKGACHE
jgi:ferredoxin